VVDGCVFTDMFGDGLHAGTITGANGVINVTVKNSWFTNAAAVSNGGVLLTQYGGPANFTADIDSNVFNDIMRPVSNLGAVSTTNGDPDGGGPTANLTFRNNTLTNLVGSRGISGTFDTFSGPTTLVISNEAVTGTSTVVGGTVCLNISGNTVPGGGVGVIRITENAAPGAINVTQSQANVAALNNGATVTVTGTPQFSQPACPTP